MYLDTKIKRDFKLFIKLVIIIFIIVFFIFNGSAFITISSYKIRTFITAFKKEITRPPTVFFSTSTSLSDQKHIVKKEIIVPVIPSEASTTNILELPKFGIKAPIWTVENLDLKLIYKKLKEGVVLYPGSAIPGKGYSIILGHSSQYPWQAGRYKSVFSLISQLDPGDKIYVYWQQKPLVFEVKEKKIFLPWPKGNETTETVFPPQQGEVTLILQSCWPVGVAYKRVAVKTVLINY